MNLFNKNEKEKTQSDGFVENKELTLIENIEDLKEPNSETGYLMEFVEMGEGEDDEKEVTE